LDAAVLLHYAITMRLMHQAARAWSPVALTISAQEKLFFGSVHQETVDFH
jgi:hypothetical protein